ncbi:MAG: PKD domain-containing protein [Solirubrobacterales bacterium]|nr:PKD domain-containing protein [Solirubrobacterales bacterium]
MRRSSVILGRIRSAALAAGITVAGLLLVTSAAGAAVIDMNPAAQGQQNVTYPTDQSSYYGVAFVPGARSSNTTQNYLQAAGIPLVNSTGPCADPAASTEPDILQAGSWPLSAPTQPICWHSGPVMHSNETFALEWEGQAPNTYWSTVKNYVHNFLSDVAAASGGLNTPYAITTQYWDGPSVQDRAANSSVFGGGCDDNGTANCKFGSITGSGAGNPLPSPNDANNCEVGKVTGNNVWGGTYGGGPATIPNNLCITDSEIKGEVTSLIDNDGLIKYTEPGHTPLVTVLTPPGVVVCLDQAGTLCSANGRLTPPAPTLTPAASNQNTTTQQIPAGSWNVVLTYDTTSGETLPSAPTSVTTTGASSTITVTSPPTDVNVTGYYVYVAPAGSDYYVRQGGVQPIGTDDMLTSVSRFGATPPTTPATFCSYHGQVTDPQTNQPVSYVVQPWTAFTSCDEPDVPTLPDPPPVDQLEKNAAMRLVSPLSQSELSAIVNPFFNGWFGQDGLEIDDQNGCQPHDKGIDTSNFGTSNQSPYYLQRESNNTSVVDSDPYTYAGCAPVDTLGPAFVAPSAINQGDTIDLDGSDTESTLAIPNANYSWNFGDGTTGTGPSVEHTYSTGGNYTVTLTVTDRGGNQATLSNAIQVLSATGLPVPVTPGGGTTPPSLGSTGLMVRLQLLPQALRSVLNSGIALQVRSTESANGFATISISRSAARRAHIKTGRKPYVVIGTGTVSQVKDGTVTLHLRLSSSMVKKLKHLKHVSLSVRLALVDSAGRHVAVDVAGSY